MPAHDLLVVRRDLPTSELRSVPVPVPGAGEVLLKVDCFALTANNVTYGVAGDSIGYWQFFQAPEPFGRIPVWGFADVLQSEVAGIAPGDRFYGYLPMSTHLVVRPERVGDTGFIDGAANRAALPPTYNQYSRCATDPTWTKADERWQMLLRPLYMTSFFLDDFLDDNDFFGAQDVVLSSASSKTAFGLAFLLHRQRRDRCRVIGLTSRANRAFVERLGCYDQVVCYDELSTLPDRPAVFVDMAGNADVRRAVHSHYSGTAGGVQRDLLRYSCGVGITHWNPPAGAANAEPLPGPKPSMFFAPSQIQKRAKEWGAGWMETRVAPAWKAFIAAADGWIDVQYARGPDAVRAAYAEMVAGRTPPNAGLILSLWD